MSEWQPIESAPKDRPVLLFIPWAWTDCICVGQWDGDHWRYPGATHWQPLPFPPYYPHAAGAP